MRISIGVPAYNQGRYLAETLDSLLRQTEPPAEIVVSDDHSTDETSEVLRRFEGRVKVIRPHEHLPMTAGFNFLVENLGGDWFAVLGSDDVAEPRFVEHLSRAVRWNRDAVMVRGGWLWMSTLGHTTGHQRLWSTASVTRAPHTFLEQLKGPKAWMSAVLCRRSAWLEAGGFPTSLRHSFDWGLFLRLSARGPFITTHRIVARCRTGYPHSKRVSRLIDAAHDERVIAMEIVPEVATSLELSAGTKLRRAAEYRLEVMLSQAGLATDAEVRARVATELRPLAIAVGRERLLDDFIAGMPVATPVRVRKLASGASVISAQVCSVSDRFTRLGRR